MAQEMFEDKAIPWIASSKSSNQKSQLHVSTNMSLFVHGGNSILLLAYISERTSLKIEQRNCPFSILSP